MGDSLGSSVWDDDDSVLGVKILCSFNGNILPRPQDGKLRYVGGDTRLLSVPIDIGFDQLMARMKDLFDGVTILKYKQPNEDLDALVSVMNDDDVMNIMEEYVKLGFGNGFTRLRLFLFSNDSHEFQGMGNVDDARYYLETPVNLHHLTIPHSRSSAYYSPRHSNSNNDDFTSPPSCSYYHCPYGETTTPPWFPQPPHSIYIRDPNDHVAMGSSLPYVRRAHYIRHRHEFGNELVHDQPISWYGNYPYVYGPLSNANLNSNSSWKDIQSPMQGSPSNESPQQYAIQNGLVESPPILEGYNGVDSYPTRPLKLIPYSYNLEDHRTSFEPVQTNDFVNGFDQSPTLVDTKDVPLQNSNATKSLINKEEKDDSICLPVNAALKLEHLSYIPQIVESVKQKALEYSDSSHDNTTEVKEEPTHELDIVDSPQDLGLEYNSGTETNSKIEQTKAEEEAIARGLQTIKNDDLEEIRQLGSGTYGAVYHGKWKGSDVAIKRIKASCFSGSPTERERMIADFWKEALMLSSLHHPNVVSFYGIVRDGPDGSLATVTEYMINGSLRQFQKKKDRTIDRRKRLIIAMDAAFGMEYLHGKNVVHFDLKCENLLVNMRDPQRPICKIGDLGLSKVKQQTMVSGGVRGTLPWMAPELLTGKGLMVTEKIDVYSFGVAMWELLTGDEPYTDIHSASLIGGIVNNTLRPTIPTWCDPEWKSLMESCWSGDPQERPSFLEISHKLRAMAATINVK